MIYGAPDGGVWIPYPARKSSYFPHPAVAFWSYSSSRITFAQFKSRVPRNFVTNLESRRQKRSYPASRETTSGVPFTLIMWESTLRETSRSSREPKLSESLRANGYFDKAVSNCFKIISDIGEDSLESKQYRYASSADRQLRKWLIALLREMDFLEITRKVVIAVIEMKCCGSAIQGRGGTWFDIDGGVRPRF